ncbi:MAG: hypothetical protein Q7R96_04895, partial [Nanoarchaeota archaeon]|nr:hypothetical protein [Nanoarchaeota archaeon]
MELIDLVRPADPFIDIETYHDCRTRMYLINKQEGRYDVLLTPFGEQSKKFPTIYLQSYPDGTTHSLTLEEITLDEQTQRNGNHYFTITREHPITGKQQRLIIPYTTELHFNQLPQKIMPNDFAQAVAKCQERFLETIIQALETTHDMLHPVPVPTQDDIWDILQGKKTFPKKITQREALESCKTLYTSGQQIYTPLRHYIEETFENTPSPSKTLPWAQRNIRDLFAQVIDYQRITKTFTQALFTSLIKDTLIKKPFKHIYASTEENKIFSFPHSTKGREAWAALLNYLKSENQKAYTVVSDINKNNTRRAAQIYHTYLVGSAIITACLGQWPIGLGIAGYTL